MIQPGILSIINANLERVWMQHESQKFPAQI